VDRGPLGRCGAGAGFGAGDGARALGAGGGGRAGVRGSGCVAAGLEQLVALERA
jgi:hypothetical protein